VVWNRRIIEVEYQGNEGGDSTESKVVAASAAGTAPKSIVLHGLGSEESEVGHTVCVFYGCSVPVVLKVAKRQFVSGKVLHKVVGEAYVHGIIDSEFMIPKWMGLEKDLYLI
jgi:hypothetical protein